MTLFSEKVLISNRCISSLMSNLIKKSWTDSTIDHFGTEHFGKSHFGTDVSSREHFGTCTVRRCGRSGRWMFQHGNVSTWGFFGMRNFWHEVPKCLFPNVNISLQGAKISMCKMFRCRNIPVPKCSCAENSSCRKVPVPKSPHVEKSPCRNVPVLKCPSAGMSAAPNGARAEMFPWWHIHAKMTIAEMFRAEMVYRRTANCCINFILVCVIKASFKIYFSLNS